MDPGGSGIKLFCLVLCLGSFTLRFRNRTVGVSRTARSIRISLKAIILLDYSSQVMCREPSGITMLLTTMDICVLWPW